MQLCLEETEIDEASKVSAELGSSAGLMLELDLKGFFQLQQFSDTTPSSSYFCSSHLQEREAASSAHQFDTIK